MNTNIFQTKKKKKPQLLQNMFHKTETRDCELADIRKVLYAADSLFSIRAADLKAEFSCI